MKKIYKKPIIDVDDINSSDIICISVHFDKNGSTDQMHAKDAVANFDDDIEDYVEQ